MEGSLGHKRVNDGMPRKIGRKLRVGPSKWEFGDVIGQRRVALGLPQAEAARRIGIERPTLSQLETGYKMSVSYETIVDISKAYGLDRSTLLALAKHEGEELGQKGGASVTNGLPRVVETGYGPFAADREIPILETRESGEAMTMTGLAVDYAPRPRGVERALGIYAFRWLGDSMVPAFRGGTLLYYDAGRPCVPGDDVLMEIGSPASSIWRLRRLVSHGNGRITVERFTPPAFEEYKESEIIRIFHILTWNEAAGV